MAELLFYVLSALALGGGAGVILARTPMASVLSLLLTFFCLGVIYLLAGFQFMAAAQVLVYAGAILVLFIFVIMLLNLGSSGGRFQFREALAGVRGRLSLAVAGALGLIGLIAAQSALLSTSAEQGIDDIEGLAAAIFGRYALAFQATGLLLLATMVGVVVLAKRQGPRDKQASGTPDGKENSA